MKLLNLCLILIMVAGTLGLPASVPAAPLPWPEKVDPWVLETAAQGETEFLVFLAQQADLSGAERLPTKEMRGQYVYETLSQLARRTQAPLLRFLERRGVPHRSYWVANMIWVRGDQSLVQALAERPDVAHLYANPKVKLALPAPPAAAPLRPAVPTTIEWNILKVNAPQVWSAGYTGQGVVIGGQDTGYEWTHPALKNQYRGWNGSSADHNYSWHDAIHNDFDSPPNGNPCGFNLTAPCDDFGHGTHTMGTMVGDDGAGNQIGMAPGAKWIGCRNMEQGDGTPATYAECYQWFIAPTDLNGNNPRPDLAPHVINNSWGCPPSEGCTDPNVLKSVVEAVRAAGILTVHSAGNSGSSCETVRDPAAIYDASFTVGSTTSSDVIATYSSRGPVTIDGSNRLKPDISAPGSNIRSSLPGSSYGVSSGTSMAAPHVAGLAALLISAQPLLAGQVDALEHVITQSAKPLTTSQMCGGVPGTSIPNNTYGWGRIDAWNAYQSLLPKLQKLAPARVLPGEVITYTLYITHTAIFPTLLNVTLFDDLPAGTTFVGASMPYQWDGSRVTWSLEDLSPLESRTLYLWVSAPANTVITITNQSYGIIGPPALNGYPVDTQVANFHYFPFLPHQQP